MLKKGNTKRSSPPAGAKGNGHKLPTNFHELFLVLILVYIYGFVKDFYRLDKILSQARQNFVKGMINFYHRLDNSFFVSFVILNEGERSLSSFDARLP